MIVLAKVELAIEVLDLKTDCTPVLEPCPPSYHGLLAANMFALVQAGLTYVRVMNPTEADIQVPSDTGLGDFHPPRVS